MTIGDSANRSWEKSTPSFKSLKRVRDGDAANPADGRAEKKVKLDIKGATLLIHEIVQSPENTLNNNLTEVSKSIDLLYSHLTRGEITLTGHDKIALRVIANRLIKIAGEHSELTKKIDTLSNFPKKRNREEGVSDQATSKRQKIDTKFDYLTDLYFPKELSREIFLNISEKDKLNLQQVSKTLLQNEYLQKSRLKKTPHIVKRVLVEISKKNLPISSLEQLMTDKTRKAVTFLNLNSFNRTLTANDLASLGQLFPNLEKLEISTAQLARISKGDLRSIASEFKNLRHLEVRKSQEKGDINTDELKVIQKFTQLESLNLSTLCITGSLKYLPNSLNELLCTSCSLTDNQIAELSHIKELERLDISLNPLQGTFLHQLPHSIREIACSSCGIEPVNLSLLQQRAGLKIIDSSADQENI